jgi:hypothetical protein
MKTNPKSFRPEWSFVKSIPEVSLAPELGGVDVRAQLEGQKSLKKKDHLTSDGN